MQFGAALAVTLMPRAGALGVVTLRLLAAAVVLLVVCRPRLRGHSRTELHGDAPGEHQADGTEGAGAAGPVGGRDGHGGR